MPPQTLESVETIIYMGYTEAKANEIWKAWLEVEASQAGGNEFQWGFLEYVLPIEKRAENDNDAGEGLEEDDWDGMMKWLGVADELRSKIMDPEFVNVRLTESARFWVHDTMELRFLMLEERMEKEARGERGHSNQEHATTTPPATSSPQPPCPAPPSGFTELWKSKSAYRIHRDSNQKIPLVCLSSKTPSDFRGHMGTHLYLFAQKEVALNHQQYLRKRVPGSPTIMIRMLIPNRYIEIHLRPLVMEFGDLWKEVVHTSRRGINFSGRGKLGYIRKEWLIIGPVSRSRSSRGIGRLGHWGEVSEGNVAWVDVEWEEEEEGFRRQRQVQARQYVFQGDDTIDDLSENAFWQEV
ncbi:MAG: hypothetical protein M1834_001187 [Cirrosporium novae-zelandiae]|nr:MAG: hypothetical protein M1834_001187 [Cirrosporium novae-zelandiae]